MAGEKIVGRVDSVQGGDVLIIRASGEQVVARAGSVVNEGDTLVAGAGSKAVINVSNNGANGVVSVSSGASARFDSVLFDRAANLLAGSSEDDPVNVGEQITPDLLRAFNESLPSAGTRTANQDSRTSSAAEDNFSVKRNNAEEIPDAAIRTDTGPSAKDEKIPDNGNPTDKGSSDKKELLPDDGGETDPANDILPTPPVSVAPESITTTPPIDALDDASVLVADTDITLEDTTLTVAAGSGDGVLDDDTDTDDTLSVASFTVNGVTTTAGNTVTITNPTTSETVGTLQINADGGYVFTPALNYNDTVPPITYTTNTGSSSTLNIDITPVNNASLLVADTDITLEDTTLTVAAGSGDGVLDDDTDTDSTLSVASFTVNGVTTTAGNTVTITNPTTSVTVGTLQINADGGYVFTPALNYNDTVPSITYTTNTGSSSTLNIDITPVNDDPPVANNDAFTVTEDGSVTNNVIGGGGGGADTGLDNGKVLISSIVGPSNGTLNMAEDGTFTYTPTANFEGPTDVFTYTVIDDDGQTDTATVTITVTPVDDASVLVADTDTTAEDTTITVLANSGEGVLDDDTDVDSTLTVASFTISGDLTVYTAAQVAPITGVGTIQLNADGGYVFTPAANYNGAVPQITYTTNTGSSSTLDITVTPESDGPPVAVADTYSTPANTALTGNIVGNDTIVDEADVDPVTNVATTNGGTISIMANGDFTYTPPAVASGTDTYVYTLRDTDGQTSTATITINIGAPAVTIPGDSATDETVVENATVSSSFSISAPSNVGSISVAGTPVTIAQLQAIGTTPIAPIATTNGTITITSYSDATVPSTGGTINYTYDPTGTSRDHNNAAETSEALSITVTDQAGSPETSSAAVLNITITDTDPVANDDARSILEGTSAIAGDAVFSSVSSGAGDVSDVLVDANATPVTDIDFGATDGTVGSALAGDYGTLIINSAGVYTYTLDNTNNTVQGLDGTESLTETFTYTITDGDGSTDTADIIVTINGVADIAVYAGDDTGAVTEDLDTDGVAAGIQLVSTGTLTVSDADTNDTPTFTAGTGTFTTTGSTNGSALGVLSIDAAGAWTYTLDNNLAAVQALDATDTVTEVYTVQASDGTDTTSHNITITINGVGDVSVYAGDDTGAVTEDLDTDGVTAGVQLVSTGTLTISDVDGDDSPTISAGTGAFTTTGSTNGSALGALTIDAAGAWIYTLDNSLAAVQALDAGDTVTEVYTVGASDGTSHDITITINGVNDISVYAGDDTGAVTEDLDTDGVTPGVQLVSTGTLTISDVDGDDTPTITAGTGAFTATGSTNGSALGALSIDAAGAWTYTLDNSLAAVQGLDASDTVTEVYTVQASDGTSHDITITINGVDDISVYAGDDTGAVTEDLDTDAGTAGVQLVSTGTLTISDKDTADTPAITAGAGSFNGTGSTNGSALGALSIDASGNWTYTLDNNLAAVQALNTSDTVIEVYTVQASDGTSHDITITINGVDDVVALVPLIPDLEGVVPNSTGLLQSFYDGNAGVSPTIDLDDTDSSLSSALESLLGATPTEVTRLVTGVGSDAINETANPESAAVSLNLGDEDLYTLTGLIYLESGHSYEFSGYRDDALHIELGGQVVVTSGANSFGNFNSGINDRAGNSGGSDSITTSTFVAPADGYYTLEVYIGNARSSGNAVLSLSDNGVVAELTVDNYQLYAGTEDLISVGAQFSRFESNEGTTVAAEQLLGNIAGDNNSNVSATTLGVKTDGGYFPKVSGPDVIGVGTVSNNISISALSVLPQNDDNTITSIVLGASSPNTIPIGAVLTDGDGNTFTASLGNTSVDVASWTHSGITINLGGVSPLPTEGSSVVLSVDATATSSTGDTATASSTFSIGILADDFETDATNSVSVDADIGADAIVDGNDNLILGTGLSDTLTADTQAGVILHGFGGNDTLNGGDNDTGNTSLNGNNTLFGGSGNDSIVAGSGEDIIFGGVGSDTIRAGFAGGAAETDTDTIIWQLGDQGTGADGANLETDIILDFSAGTVASGHDVLDFSGLLVGEKSGTIGDYITLTESGGNTTLAIDVEGDASGTDLNIQLNGITGISLATLISEGNIVFDTVDNLILRGSETSGDIINGTANSETIFENGATNGGSLRGGGGNDIFKYESDDTYSGNPNFRVRDFTHGTGAEADTLDLSDLLAGATAANIDDYINIRFNFYNSGGNGIDVFEIYANGNAPSAASGTSDFTLEMQNTDFNSISNTAGLALNANTYDATDEAAILAQLLADGNLIV